MDVVEPRTPRIPDYTLLEPIGRGAYGEVWLALGVTGERRAVKVVWRHRFATADPFERELRGVTLFAGLSVREPRLLTVLHVGRSDADGCFYYVMELADTAVQGADPDGSGSGGRRYRPRTLEPAGGESARRAPAEVIRLGIDLAEALSVLHQAGLVHRDIKPANVIYVAGVPKLADIGLIAETGAQSFVGTEGYIAPEGPGTPAADVFSLGRLLYELATGRDRRDFPRLPEGMAGVGDAEALVELMAVLNRACERDPVRRYADAAALLADLRLVQVGKSARRLWQSERHMKQAIRLALVLGTLAAVASAGAWLERGWRQSAEVARRWAVYSGILARAQQAAAARDLAGARALLSRPDVLEPPAARGLEWEVIARGLEGPKPVGVVSGGGPVRDVRAMVGGERYLVLEGGGVVVVREGLSGSVVSRHAGIRQLAGVDASGHWVRLLREDGRLVQEPVGPGSTGGLEMDGLDGGIAGGTPDGGTLVVTNGFADTVVRVLDLQGTVGRVPGWVERLRIDVDPAMPNVWGVGMDDRGRVLALGRLSKGTPMHRLEVWRVGSGVREASLETSSVIWAVDVSPDGRWVAAGFDSGEILVLPVPDGSATVGVDGEQGNLGTAGRELMESGVGRPRSIRFSASGDSLLTLGEGGLASVRTLDPESPPWLVVSRDLATVAEWGVGGGVITGHRGGELAHWAGMPPASSGWWSRRVDLPLMSLAVSADGSRLAVSSGPDAMDLVSVLEGRSVLRLEGGFRPVAFLPDGSLAALDVRSRLRFWPAGGVHPEEVTEIGAAAFRVVDLATCGDGRHAVLGGESGQVAVWDLVERRRLALERPHGREVLATAACLRHPLLATAAADGSVWVWQGDRRTAGAWRMPRSTGVTALAISPDGKVLALVQAEVGLVVMDLERPGVPGRVMPLPKRSVYEIAFSADGRRLVLGGSAGVLDFRETGTWAEVGTYQVPVVGSGGNRRPINLESASSGTVFAAMLANGSVHWWRVGVPGVDGVLQLK